MPLLGFMATQACLAWLRVILVGTRSGPSGFRPGGSGVPTVDEELPRHQRGDSRITHEEGSSALALRCSPTPAGVTCQPHEA
jgi:hypothetical protein